MVRSLGKTNVLESGLYELGYKQPEYPLHFYAPIIEDWSGAKFSKSMYIKGDDYSNIPEELLNFKKFKDTFGNKGLDVLWEEVVDWTSSPKKFFRNYSLEYFLKLFQEKELI